MLDRSIGGEVYNIGSNTAWKIWDIVGMLIDASRVKGIELEEQSRRIRPNDIPVMRCDASKVEQAIGWLPEIPIEQALQDLLNDWRDTIIGYI